MKCIVSFHDLSFFWLLFILFISYSYAPTICSQSIHVSASNISRYYVLFFTPTTFSLWLFYDFRSISPHDILAPRMSHPNASWLLPDKLIKDILWDDLVFSSHFVHGKLLDVGCGGKPYQKIFQHRLTSYIGIDAYDKRADIQKDFLATTLLPNSFHTVLTTQVLEHVPHPSVFLKKIFRILKPSGILILTAPLIASLHETPRDYFRFTEYGLRQLLSDAGFEILVIKGQGNYISSIATFVAFYFESTCNRYFLKYPKQLLNAIFLYIFFLFSKLPNQLTKPHMCPMNYLVIARKR